MKKVTRWMCSGCNKLFEDENTHSEVTCIIEQKKAQEENNLKEYMNSVYLGEQSADEWKGPKLIEDNTGVSSWTVEVLEFDEEGTLTKFRVFELMQGTRTITYEKKTTKEV